MDHEYIMDNSARKDTASSEQISAYQQEANMSNEFTSEEVDLSKHPNAQNLYDNCLQFFNEVENL